MSQMPTGPSRPSINLHGAVDLSGLKRPDPAAGAGAAPVGDDGRGGFTAVAVDATEALLERLLQQSLTVPVVFDLGAPSAEASRTLTRLLESLATEHAGGFLLARVDAQANPQIAAAFRVEGLPAVVAVVKGQPVPLFQGVPTDEQVREVIGQVLAMAQANGVTGRLVLDGEPAPEPVEEELPPLHAAAYEAIERDDLDAAAQAYRDALAQNPADDLAKAGLAQVELMRRTRGADLSAARAAAAAGPDDVDAQLLVADLDVLGGHVQDAFVRLVDVVRRTAGDDRERVRARLVELFEVVGGQDERVVAARRALASALF